MSRPPKALLLPVVMACLQLAGCASYEPAVLTPAVTLSPEAVTLGRSNPDSTQRSFGLDVTRNESDSLFNIEVLPGVRVRSVSPGGAAATSGLQAGDIILAIDEVEVNQPDAIRALEQQTEQNSFAFTVRRDTTVFEAVVVARQANAASAPVELYRVDPVASRAGYRSELLSVDGRPEIVAAEIRQFYPDSPLPGAGLNVGDLILAIDGGQISSAQDLVNRLNNDYELGETVSFSVYDGQTVMEREVTLWNPGRRLSRLSLGPLLQYESSLNPPGQSLSIIDLWLFALYRYQQTEGERSHSVLGLFNFSSDYGELIEEQ